MNTSKVETFDISGFPKDQLHVIWPELEPLLELGLSYSAGEYTSVDLYHAISEGIMQLWVASEGLELRGIVVTEFIHFPRRIVCQVILAAGTVIDKWEHCLDLIEQWAYDAGADEMRSYARPGWKRKAQEHGYDMQYCIYRKLLRTAHENSH